MIKNELVNRSIDYIMQHLEEEITIEDVANYCHFSKYHFSRVFKAETGMSIYAFIKRLKMEQSAFRLKIEKDKSITDVGVQYGYSPSNYSSVFKKHHSVSPVKFRNSLNTNCVTNPFYIGKRGSFKTFKEYDEKVSIEVLEDFFVIYERRIGNYINLGKYLDNFAEKYKNFFTENTLLIERSYDDPSITSIDQCLYDVCMTVDKNCTLNNVTTIKGGKYAVYHFEGYVQDIYIHYQGLFNIWLKHSSEKMDERYGLDIYREIDRENMYVKMDVCIPIK